MNNRDITAEWLYQKRIDGGLGTVSFTDKNQQRVATLKIMDTHYLIVRAGLALEFDFGNEIEAVRFYNGEVE